MQHGFDRNYALGNLNEASLGELTKHWHQERYRAFRELCQQVYQQLTAPADLPITDWYETLMQLARTSGNSTTVSTVQENAIV